MSQVTPSLQLSRQEDRPSLRSTAQISSIRRRYIPYRKTPGSRQVGPTERYLERTPTESVPLNLAGLVTTTWRVYKLTPLFKFSENVQSLRRCGRLLSAFIEADIKKGNAIDLDGEVADKAEFSQYKGLQISQDDPLAIQVLLKAKSKLGNGELRVVLTAYLCGVEMREALEPRLRDVFTYYPVLLVKGTIGLTRYLTDWLKSQFDCAVSPMAFSSLDLTWMLAMWSGQLTGGAQKPVELMYSAPKDCEGLNKITLTINAQDCKEVWDCLHDKTFKDITSEEVATFITSLENHFYHHFKVKLSAMHLSRVGTSIAYVGAEGKLKMFSEDHVLQVLRHITSLAIEQLE